MEKETKVSLKNKIMFIVGSVLCVILLPLLIMNIIMIVKTYTNSNEVPSVGKYVPFIVLTDSMEGTISSGDLIIGKKIDPEDIEVGMVISFYDPAGNGTSVVTHRVIDINQEELLFQTKGDANNVEDEMWVPAKNIISVYKFRIPFLGNVSYFMSTTTGLLVCVLVPICLFVVYDVTKHKLKEKENKEDTNKLLEELEMLKAEKKKLEEEKENKEKN